MYIPLSDLTAKARILTAQESVDSDYTIGVIELIVGAVGLEAVYEEKPELIRELILGR